VVVFHKLQHGLHEYTELHESVSMMVTHGRRQCVPQGGTRNAVQKFYFDQSTRVY